MAGKRSDRMKEIALAVGQRIKEIREEAGLSQERFAREIDRSRQTIYEAEAGRRIPDWETLERIAEYGGLDPRELLQSPAPGPASRNRTKAR